MKIRTLLLCAVAAAFVLPATARAGERVKAKVDCQPAGKRLVYDCTIMLMGRKSGKPIDNAKIVVNADMPSMAMAHIVRPVNATATGKPGMYRAKIQLEMYGEWALKLDVSGPTRDRLIHKAHFGAPAGAKAGMKDGDKMKMPMGGDKMKMPMDGDKMKMPMKK